jgi:hypothetical protein
LYAYYFIPFLVMVFIIELHRGCGAGTYFRRTTICGNDIGGLWLLRSQQKRQSILPLRSFRSMRTMRSTLINPRYGTVLEQTTSLYQDMLQKEGWEGKTDFVVDSVNRLTLRVRITPNYLESIIIYLIYNRSHFWS